MILHQLFILFTMYFLQSNVINNLPLCKKKVYFKGLAFVFFQTAFRSGGNPHPTSAGRMENFTVEGTFLLVVGNLKRSDSGHSNLFQC